MRRRPFAGLLLTYSMYMWRPTIIMVLMNALGDKILHLPTWPMVALAVVTYGAILVWSLLSLKLYEAPARRWIDGLGRRSAMRA